AGVGSVAAARSGAARRRVRALPRGLRVRAADDRVHPPQQRGRARADGAPAGEHPGDRRRRGMARRAGAPRRRGVAAGGRAAARAAFQARRHGLTRERTRRAMRSPGRTAIITADMATRTTLSPVFPLGSRLNERGVLEIGGCDALELAREFGTPAYVVAEEDLLARARTFVGAARELHPDMHVVFASKAFPCTAVLSLFAREGLWCDVATGGELYLALNAGFAPERIVMHGNAKSEAELRMALRHRVGLIVIDNFDEIERLGELIGDGALGDREGGQPVLVRVTPDVRGDTHEKISTGQADSKFGFAIEEVQDAVARVGRTAGLALDGLHAHIG